MGITAKKQRAINALCGAIIAHRLSDGVDVLLVKAAQRRRAAMPRGAEGNALGCKCRIGKISVIRAHERGDVLQLFQPGQMPGIISTTGDIPQK